MVNRKAMVPYCEGAPGPAPAGGGGGGGVGARGAVATATFLASDVSEAAGPFMALIGGAPWAVHGSAEGARALMGPGSHAGPLTPIGPWPEAPRFPIGPLGVPRSPVGRAAPEEPAARPQSLPLPPPPPEEELDGCEPEPAGTPLLPSPSPSLSPAQEREPEAAGGGGDDLRKVTLAVVGRYLREAAALEEQPDAQGGGGGAKVLLQGLWERLGSAAGSPLLAPPEPEVGRALETLRRVGGGILEKHQLAFQGMLRKMEIKNENDLKTVSEVAKFVFDDGITNWGRIATLISFGAFVAKHLKSIQQEGCINSLAEIITEVLVTDKRDWLVEHHAWEGFVKFFHVEDIEGSVRSVLMAFAGVAGLGASLAYMIR